MLVNNQYVWPSGVRLQMRIAAACSYVLASTPGVREPGGLVPIALVPNVTFDAASDWDITNSNSVVSQLETVISNWYHNPDNTPARTDGASYVFDFTNFASGSNSQPLIRASTCQYMIQRNAGGV
jgi:hypothetical protein